MAEPFCVSCSTSTPAPATLPKVVFVSSDSRPVNLRLDHILANVYGTPVDSQGLQTFANSEFRGENVRFLVQVKLFKEENVLEFVVEYGNLIVKEFIAEGSPQEVNISAKVRSQTLGTWSKLIKNASPSGFVDEEAEEMKEMKHVFDAAWDQVFEMVDKDILPRFQKYIVHKENCSLARAHALWCWNVPSFSTFFTFPNPVNTAESRIHAYCCAMLGLSIILANFFERGENASLYSWTILSYLCFGFWARFACGPRIDPQAFLVLFILRPVVVDYLRLFKSEWIASGPRRFAQFAGAMMSSTVLILYTTNNELAALILLAVLVILNLCQAALNYCMACVVYYMLVSMKILPVDKAAHADAKYLSLFTSSHELGAVAAA